MNVRNQGLDVARVALILYIVTTIHGSFWLKLIPELPASWLLFEMPLIFIVSGWAFALSDKWAANQSYFSYFIGRTGRLLIPFLFYAFVCATLFLISLILKKEDLSFLNALQVYANWLNPFTAGSGDNIGMLQWHLWFISPFLIVTWLLPFLIKLPFISRLPLWGWVIFGFLGTTTFQFLPDLLQTGLFYCLWALLGYSIMQKKPASKEYLLCFAIAAAALAATALIAPDSFTWNMQSNKFPPNNVFFLFSCLWASTLLLLGSIIPSIWSEKISQTKTFNVLNKASYSIFLWQGVGYTIGYYAGKILNMPSIISFMIAVPATICIGIIASPLERLKLGPKRIQAKN